MNSYLQTFELDVNISATTKAECLKFLSVILKNVEKEDPKYRQLKLGNAKVQRLTSHISILSFLQSLGFQKAQESGEDFLRCSTAPSSDAVQAAKRAVQSAEERVQCHLPSKASTAQLSEKQKARILQQQKSDQEKMAAKESRKRTVAQIAADKHTREHDPDWKPTVSSAAAKTGTPMQTFRDKFGE